MIHALHTTFMTVIRKPISICWELHVWSSACRWNYGGKLNNNEKDRGFVLWIVSCTKYYNLVIINNAIDYVIYDE